jgi:hypothetical protein
MFKKGDQVVRIKSWDNKGTFVQDELTIKSWGKVQGTVSYTVSGEMLEERVYVDHVAAGHEYCGTWFHAGDPTINEVGAKLAEEKHARVIADIKSHIEQYADRPAYVKAQKANLFNVLGMKPRVVSREVLLIELAARRG